MASSRHAQATKLLIGKGLLNLEVYLSEVKLAVVFSIGTILVLQAQLCRKSLKLSSVGLRRSKLTEIAKTIATSSLRAKSSIVESGEPQFFKVIS
jgi:hypothetical protein